MRILFFTPWFDKVVVGMREISTMNLGGDNSSEEKNLIYPKLLPCFFLGGGSGTSRTIGGAKFRLKLL